MQEKLPRGISKGEKRYRVNTCFSGKCYYLGSVLTLEGAKELLNEALAQKEQGTFLEWYNEKTNIAAFEESRQGKYFTREEARELAGVSEKSLGLRITALGLKLFRKKRKKYFTLEDIEKIKEQKRMDGLIDITGEKYSKLKAVRLHEHIVGKPALWEWECECGRTFISPARYIKKLRIKSCGCDYTRSNTGIKGVSWDKRKKKFIASLNFQNKRYLLEEFNDLAQAVKARQEASAKVQADPNFGKRRRRRAKSASEDKGGQE